MVILLFKKKRVCFSLIELFVVISILATMLTLLLPSLKNVMNGADTALCQTRLKALGRSYSFYGEDHNEMIAYGRSFHWSNMLPEDYSVDPPMKIMATEGYIEGDRELGLTDTWEFNDAFHQQVQCPSNMAEVEVDKWRGYGSNMDNFYNFTNHRVWHKDDYVMKDAFTNIKMTVPYSTEIETEYFYWSLNAIPNPSLMFFSGDSMNKSLKMTTSIKTGSKDNMVGVYHDDASNLLMADGHVLWDIPHEIYEGIRLRTFGALDGTVLQLP